MDVLTLVIVVGGKSGLRVIPIVVAIEPLLLICPCWLYDIDLLAEYLTVQRAMAGGWDEQFL